MTNDNTGNGQLTETERQVLTAAILGTIAFNEGRNSVPCLDPALIALLKGNKVGESIAVLKAWTHSWDAANLATTL
jgi:hypothetical protein